MTYRCACGAKMDTVTITCLGDPRPTTVPGPLLEPCTCPRCILCGSVLDVDQRCDNLDCSLVGVHIVVPD